MVILLIGSAVVLLLLVLAVVLATGSVVSRLAVHMRDDSWGRITSQQGRLRQREREILDHLAHGKCAACDDHHHRAATRHDTERKA